MVQVKTNRSRSRRRRRWSHFSESQITLASLQTLGATAVKRAETGTTKSEMIESTQYLSAPSATAVTPSPLLSRRDKQVTDDFEFTDDAPKQLFPSAKEKRQSTKDSGNAKIVEQKKLSTTRNRRRLFKGNDTEKATNETAKETAQNEALSSEEPESSENKPLESLQEKRSKSIRATETMDVLVNKVPPKRGSKPKAATKPLLKIAQKVQPNRTMKPGSQVPDRSTAKTLEPTKTSPKTGMAMLERNRKRKIRGSRRMKNSWDSLASICSVTTNKSVTDNSVSSELAPAPIPKTVTQDADDHSVAYSVLSHPTSVKQSSEGIPQSPPPQIPPALLSVLAPRGLPRKLRTSAEILKDTEEFEETGESDETGESEDIGEFEHPVQAPTGRVPKRAAKVPPRRGPKRAALGKRVPKSTVQVALGREPSKAVQVPPRRPLSRACKDQRKVSYNEDSDDEEGLFQSAVPLKLPKLDSECENGFGGNYSDSPSLEALGDKMIATETTAVSEEKTSEGSSLSEDSTGESRPKAQDSRTNDANRRGLPIRKNKKVGSENRDPIAQRSVLEIERNGVSDRRSNRRSRDQPRKLSSHIVGDEDLGSVLAGSKLLESVQEDAGERRDNRHSSRKGKVAANDDGTHESHQIDQMRKKESKSANEMSTITKTRATIQQDPDETLDSQNHSVTTRSVVEIISKSSKNKKHSKKKKSKKKKNSKVRWAPLPTATTTFSVKIRVKTSLDGRSSSGNVQLPALDESTVQAIADQVTQACLMQARNNPSMLAPTNTVARTAPRPLNESAPRNEGQHTENNNNYSSVEKSRSKPFEIAVDCNSSVVSDLTRERTGRDPVARKRKIANINVEDDKEDNDFDVPMDSPDDMDSVARQVDEQDTRLEAAPRREQLRPGTRRVESKSDHSKKRRRKIWSCSDSLAGSFTSLSTTNSKKASWRSGRTSTKVKAKPVSPSRSTIRKREEPTLDIGNDFVIPAPRTLPATQAMASPIRKRKEYTLPADPQANVRCETCPGCTRIFDCMNCDACLARLQAGETSSQVGTESDCLRRVCRRASKSDEASLGTMMSQPQSRTAKDIPEQDDMSYISEVEWGSEKRASKPGKPLSRASRLWSQQYAKQPGEHVATGSVSSVTTLTGMRGPATKAKNGRRRKGSKKNPLHYLEMPMATDGSVASWIESRRVRQALMNYDEADQDWVD